MKIKLILFILILAITANAQLQYNTIKQLNDSTFIVVRTSSNDDAQELDPSQALRQILSDIDNYYRIENRKYNQWLDANKIAKALEQDLTMLFPDTSYSDYNSRWDTIYSNASREEIYSSRLIVRDSTSKPKFYG